MRIKINKNWNRCERKDKFKNKNIKNNKNENTFSKPKERKIKSKKNSLSLSHKKINQKKEKNNLSITKKVKSVFKMPYRINSFNKNRLIKMQQISPHR